MPKKLTLKQLAKACGGTILRAGLSNDVWVIAFDSRKISEAEHTVFFALKTAVNNGLYYIDEAYLKGVRTFVVPPHYFPDKRLSEASFVEVDDPLKALQRLATNHRQSFKGPVLGITGSNGKTIIKDWLAQLLEPDGAVCKSPKSYNSQLGVPLSVWELKEGDALAIFEAGISQPGDMDTLADIIQANQGILTNIGEAHSENFVDLREKTNEKLKLFRLANRLIYRADQPVVQEAVTAFAQQHPALELVAWATDHEAEYQVKWEESAEGTAVTISGKAALSFVMPFNDKASLENAMHVWVWLYENGYWSDKMAERMKRLSAVQMRMEMKAAIQHSTLINDSYSLDLDSLAIALDYLGRLSQYKKKTVIISDFDQASPRDEKRYGEMAKRLKEHGVYRLVGVGEQLKKHKKLFLGIETHFFETTAQAVAEIPRLGFVHEAILLKGARRFGFERLEQLLALKQHQTVLEIDLDALLHNYQYYRSRLKSGTRMMVMVKAFSYGSGTFEVASLLQHHGADYLAVAYADEGVALREAGIRLPIMVMNVEPDALDKLLQYQLEPEVYSFRLLDELLAYMRYTDQSGLNIHINIDTGMKRLGFEPDEVNKLGEKLKNQREIKVASVYSHLVASEAPEHQAFTLQQIQDFRQAAARLQQYLGYKPLEHILNTAGIINYPEAQFDMVRLGIGLYGYDSSGNHQAQVQAVGSLKTVISQIKKLKPGETVGYNRMGKTNGTATIATLPLGYADGIGRQAGNGRMQVWINGQLAPTIGNICMDMLMVDVSLINCKEGDEVIVFGSKHPITQLAEALGTIPYEVLTNVSQRVKRVYLKD
jgi:alanine racemase